MKKPKLAEKVACTGCSACKASCVNKSISMCPDEDGFLRPLVDLSLCVKCGACEEVCPVLHSEQHLFADKPCNAPLQVFAAKSKDVKLQMDSTSGGVFTLLAEDVLSKGGVVYGAGWETGSWRVIHKGIETTDELADLRGSKYVQSDMGNVLCEAKKALKQGRHVLFTGTPCQVAAANSFLGNPSNLILCEIICHAVPSPKMWEKYVEEIQKIKKDHIRVIRFRAPGRTLNASRFVVEFKNRRRGINQQFAASCWGRFFFGEFLIRPSCNACRFREGKSGADISIGDFWGLGKCHPEFVDNKGVSVVIVHTKKGADIFGRQNVLKVLSSYAFACENNEPIFTSTTPKPKQSEMFRRVYFHNGGRFIRTVRFVLDGPWYKRYPKYTYWAIRHWVGNILLSLGLRK